MDEEDLADAEETRRLKTQDSFAELGSTANDNVRDSNVMDVFKPSGGSKGLQLLHKMGWRDGQGIGPKVHRKAKLDDDGLTEGFGEVYRFAPADSSIISIPRKDNLKGLGYRGEARLDGSVANEQPQRATEDSRMEGWPVSTSLRPKPQQVQRGGFGVGILNDTGSDDEDPFALGPRISYNKTVGGDKKKKKTDQLRKPTSKSHPLLITTPTFIPRKAARVASRFRTCHDGRLPLDGFVLASTGSATQDSVRYPPPVVPGTWRPSKELLKGDTEVSKFQSTIDLAKIPRHDPSSRAAILGEAALPGKSVFDFMKPNARDRLVEITKNDLLPVAGSESFSPEATGTCLTIPELDAQNAATALGRGVSGFIPYSDNPDKLSRYRAFLSYRAGLTPNPPLMPSTTQRDEWTKELEEFAHAATIFKPMTGLMAARFTSSSSATAATFDATATTGKKLLTESRQKPLNPAEEAAKMGMFGPLTRSSMQFFPSRLLCKRFNVPVPSHVTAEDEGLAAATPATPALLAHEQAPASSDTHLNSGSRFKSSGFQSGSRKSSELLNRNDMETLTKEAGLELNLVEDRNVIEPNRNEALEVERPGDAIFKAIFGSDSEEE